MDRGVNFITQGGEKGVEELGEREERGRGRRERGKWRREQKRGTGDERKRKEERNGKAWGKKRKEEMKKERETGEECWEGKEKINGVEG